MEFTNKFCNPTPFPVKLNYEKGINLRIPPFGEIELNINQVDDFRGNKPGSEAVLVETDFFGVFLKRPDKSYDSQALEAIEKSLNAKNTRYQDSVRRLREQRSASGFAPDEEALDEAVKHMGMHRLRDEVVLLKQQAEKLRKIVAEEPVDSSTEANYDPKRTVFVMDPPTEFPSVAQMEFFLDLPENAQIKERHAAFAQANTAEPAAVEETTNEAD